MVGKTKRFIAVLLVFILVMGANMGAYADTTQLDSNHEITQEDSDGDLVEDITINYEATTGGAVDILSESLAPTTGEAVGSTATADEGYTFKNWTDADKNEVSTDALLIPAKVDGLNLNGTYTANFIQDEDGSDLAEDEETDPNEMGENPDGLSEPEYIDAPKIKEYKTVSLRLANDEIFSSKNVLMRTFTLMEASSDHNNIESPNPGSLDIDKVASSTLNPNQWRVDLTLTGKDIHATSDIVLVIDRSGSMRGGKMTSAKDAAKAFVNTLLDEDDTNTRIAVVSFAGDVTSDVFKDSTNKNDLITAIDGLSADGGTFIQAGIKQANTLLDGSSADKKSIVLLGDGEATYSYKINNPNSYATELFNPNDYGFLDGSDADYRTTSVVSEDDFDYNNIVGNGDSSHTRYDNGNKVDRYYRHGASSIAEAGFAKDEGYDIYTIALEVDANSEGEWTLDGIASSGNAYTGASSDLQEIFQTIAGSLSYAATDATITDPMGDKFSIPGITSDNFEEKITVNRGDLSWDATTETITWELDTISEGNPATMWYIVEIDSDAVSGQVYPTNRPTGIEYTNALDVQAVKAFPEPEAGINAGTIKIHYYRVDSTGNPINSVGVSITKEQAELQVLTYPTSPLVLNTPYVVSGPATVNIGGTNYQYNAIGNVGNTNPVDVTLTTANPSADVWFAYEEITETEDVTITYVAGTGGTVDNSSESLAPATGRADGSTATANAGYTFKNWTDASGAVVGTVAKLVPAKVEGLNVAGDYTANFTKDEDKDVKITYEAATGGTVSSAGETLAPATGVADGSTATANAGYTFTNWTDASGAVVGTVAKLVPAKVSDLNVAGDYTANFTEDEDVTITYEAGTGGTVDNLSESLAPATGRADGSTATANAGYTFTNWTDASGAVVGTVAKLVPAKVEGLNVAGDYTANFTEDEDVTITYEAAIGGTVSSAGETLAPATGVADGSTATANSGYTFTNWTEDGVEVSTDVTFIPAKVEGLNVAGDYTANFAKDEDVTITYEAAIGGTVSSAGETLAPATGVADGSTATANAGYTFTNWTEDGVEVSTDATFIPAKVGDLNVAGDYTANFTEDEDVTITYEAGTGGAVDNSSESLAPATGEAVGSTATANAGYTFKNWTDASGAVVGTVAKLVPEKVEGLNVAGDYTANFTKDGDVTINYEAAIGGTVDNVTEDLAPATGVAVGSTATANAGYTFTNWTDISGAIVSMDATLIPEKVEGLNVAGMYTANFDKNEEVSYTVNYLVQETETVLATAKTGNGTLGLDVTENAIDIAGYNKVSPTEITITLGVSLNVINFYYTASDDIQYTVNYLKTGTNTVLKTAKIGSGELGEEITESAVTISGYNKISPTSVTIELMATGNEITFFYKAKSSSGGGGGGETITVDQEVPEALPELNREDHFQYIQGYPDNTVRPEGLITREEVAAVFFRLLAVDYRDSIRTTDNDFPDVEVERWSTKHIATLANGEIVEGYEDGSYRPGEYITRAELATIASRFDNLSPFESNEFSDISGHWANKYINSAAQKGWVNGYPDGTFKPDQYITRAEFVTLVNNVLDRRVHKEDILPEAREFPDLLEAEWYYENMQEAINSHYYERNEDTYEEWIEIYYPMPEM